LVAEELKDAGFTVVVAVNADHAISMSGLLDPIGDRVARMDQSIQKIEPDGVCHELVGRLCCAHGSGFRIICDSSQVTFMMHLNKLHTDMRNNHIRPECASELGNGDRFAGLKR
jgi:hypothetical protein